MADATPLVSILLTDARGERRLDLAAGSYVFGRDASCDCALDSKRASRQHLKLVVDRASVSVEDLMSANGSLLNGQHLARTTRVKTGDVVEMGDAKIVFDYAESAEPVATPTPARASRPPSAVSSGVRRAPASSSSTKWVAPAFFVILLVAGGTWAMKSGLLSKSGETVSPAGPAPKAPSAGETARLDHRVRECLASEDFAQADDALREYESAWGQHAATSLRTLLTQSITRAAADTETEVTRLRAMSADDQALTYLRRRMSKFPSHAADAKRLENLMTELAAVTERPAGSTVIESPLDPKPPAAKPPVARAEAESATPTPAGKKTAAPKKAEPSAEEKSRTRAEARTRYTELRPKADIVFTEKRFAEAATQFRDLESYAREAGLSKAVVGDAGRKKRTAERHVRLAAAINEAAKEKADKLKDIPVGAAARGALVGASPEGFTVDVSGEKKTLDWKSLAAETVAVAVKRAELDAEGELDAAGVLLALGDTAVAYKLLHAVDQRHGNAVHPALDQVLADDLGIELPATPFVWFEDSYLSPADFARIGAQKVIDRETARLASTSAKERADAYAKLEALGDVAKSAYHRALSAAKAEFAKKLAATGSWKAIQAIADARAAVERGRESALTLIFDEEKYPYPYHGAGVSPEAARNFEESQKLIDERLAALRKLWNDEHAVPVTKDLLEARDRLIEFDEHLTKLGLGMGVDTLNVLHFLPPSGEITIRNFAETADERFRIDESDDWIRRNEKDTAITTKNELDEIRITNEYRLMMGRHAIRIHPLLMKSARGHSQDMVRLGFFDHMNEKEPEKRTPWDRMKLAGFKGAGASENLAVAGGPSSAHNSWLHSSGHHRNILEPGHRLFGVGNDGRHWTQNFSSSAEDEATLFGETSESKPAEKDTQTAEGR